MAQWLETLSGNLIPYHFVKEIFTDSIKDQHGKSHWRTFAITLDGDRIQLEAMPEGKHSVIPNTNHDIVVLAVEVSATGHSTIELPIVGWRTSGFDPMRVPGYSEPILPSVLEYDVDELLILDRTTGNCWSLVDEGIGSVNDMVQAAAERLRKKYNFPAQASA